MNAQVNTVNTHSNTDSRLKTKKVQKFGKTFTGEAKNGQFLLEGYSGHQTSIIGRDV